MTLSNPSLLTPVVVGTPSGNASTVTSGSFTPTANALIVLCIEAWNTTASPDPIAISDTLGGLTWTVVQTYNSLSQCCSAIATATAPSSPTAGTITATAASSAGGAKNISLGAYQVAGQNVSSPVGATLAVNTVITGSLSSAPAASSLVITTIHDASGATGSFTTPAGYTTLLADTTVSPYSWWANAYKNGSASQTVTWTEASENSPTLVAIEVKAAAITSTQGLFPLMP